MDVISLDCGRVKIYDNYVTKITTENEYKSLKIASSLCEKLNLLSVLGKKYKISIPDVYDYQNGLVIMSRCFGDNLELLLRNKISYDMATVFSNELLSFFISNEFYWKDFAPRNILIDESKISIVDFERGISQSVPNIQSYLINNVYEEYAAFILPENRIYNTDDIFNCNKLDLINISNISSNRIKSILNIQDYHEFVPVKDFIQAIKMIVINETPYKIKENIIFPILELEDYMKNYGYNEYAKKIIGDFHAKQKRI